MYSFFLIYTPLHSCPPLFKAVLQLINPQAVQYPCRFCPHLINWWKMGSLQYTSHFGVQKKSHRVLNPRIWRMYKYWNAFIGKKLLVQKGIVSWGIIPTLFFHWFGRFVLKICRTVSLLIPIISAIILTLRYLSLWTISLIFWMFWSVFQVEGWPGC